MADLSLTASSAVTLVSIETVRTRPFFTISRNFSVTVLFLEISRFSPRLSISSKSRLVSRNFLNQVSTWSPRGYLKFQCWTAEPWGGLLNFSAELLLTCWGSGTRPRGRCLLRGYLKLQCWTAEPWGGLLNFSAELLNGGSGSLRYPLYKHLTPGAWAPGPPVPRSAVQH